MLCFMMKSSLIEADSILLCNEELYSKIDELYPVSDRAEETVKCLEEQEICEIMKNMTSQIGIAQSKMKTISKPLFHSIISNDHLRIETEDWLLDTIIDYFEDEIGLTNGSNVSVRYDNDSDEFSS